MVIALENHRSGGDTACLSSSEKRAFGWSSYDAKIQLAVFDGNYPEKRNGKDVIRNVDWGEALQVFQRRNFSPHACTSAVFWYTSKLRTLKILRFRPFLRYVEIHLVDYCNLNCRGCSHFSPVAKKWAADVNQYEKDMRRLTELFGNIKRIRLMGGEPLLHPQIESFVTLTRRYFPKSDIRVVTNGILLPAMQDSFWKTCRSNSAILDITIYPPLKDKEQFLRNLANSKLVKTNVHFTSAFSALYNDKGDSDVNQSFVTCRKWQYCPNLRQGRLYVCPVPAYAHYFNEAFESHIPEDGWLDIHAQGLSGWDVLTMLEKATSACAYCMLGSERIRAFPWSASTQSVKDWQIIAE